MCISLREADSSNCEVFTKWLDGASVAGSGDEAVGVDGAAETSLDGLDNFSCGVAVTIGGTTDSGPEEDELACIEFVKPAKDCEKGAELCVVGVDDAEELFESDAQELPDELF